MGLRAGTVGVDLAGAEVEPKSRESQLESRIPRRDGEDKLTPNQLRESRDRADSRYRQQRERQRPEG